jgi:uncharacterized protein (TIGR00369 family)
MTHLQNNRTRTVNWEDPRDAVQRRKTLSGKAQLEALRSGEFPPSPVAVLLGTRITEVSEGHVVFTMEPAEYHYNLIGTVHGGVIATILDSTLSCAILSVLPPETGCSTIELKVNYLRPLTVETGTVYGDGKIIHVGERTATAEARLTDATGKLYAHATGTCIIFRPTSS